MLCVDETKCFTIKWEIENFRKYSSPNDQYVIRSSAWKTETTVGSTWWRFLLDPCDLDLEFALVNLNAELKEKDYRYEMFILTPSGEVQLTRILNKFNCCYDIEKQKIFSESSKSFLFQGTLTLCCRIWQRQLKPGRCLLRNSLHEVNFPWSIDGLNLDSFSTKRSLQQQEKMLFSMFLYKYRTENGTHRVRVELLPESGRRSTFISCTISINDGCGQVASNVSEHLYPKVSWEWDIEIYPEKIKDNNLHLEFETLISVDGEHQQFPLSSDADGHGSANTLSDDLLQLYKKRTLSDVTLNSEGKSFQAHRIVLATRSPVLQAMFEKDQMIEGQSGVVDIEDVDSETMDRFLVYLYSDSLEDLQWNEASALYYAADKYAVLPLKKKCAEILIFGLTPDNVCDALILADKHSDEQLMSCAVDFVRDRKEILASSAWENLEASCPQLTIKVFRQVILKKVRK